MSNLGFVYILTNQHMPGIYKVGCTERSPHARAEELSKPTGVPSPFKVLAYIEVNDFQVVERDVHKWLAEYRISESREFFEGGLEFACRILFWLPRRLSFVEPGAPGDGDALTFLQIEGEINPTCSCWMQTTDPFRKPAPVEPPADSESFHVRLVKAAGGFD